MDFFRPLHVLVGQIGHHITVVLFKFIVFFRVPVQPFLQPFYNKNFVAPLPEPWNHYLGLNNRSTSLRTIDTI